MTAQLAITMTQKYVFLNVSLATSPIARLPRLRKLIKFFLVLLRVKATYATKQSAVEEVDEEMDKEMDEEVDEEE